MELTAVINDTREDVEIIMNSQGITSKKRILYKQFVDTVANTLGKQATRISLLPNSMVDGYFYDNSNCIISIFIPKAKHKIAFMKEENTSLLPFPGLLFFFKIKEMRIQSTYVFATKVKNVLEITDKTELFNYPLGNVTPFSGKVCWGLNQMGTLSSLKQLEFYTQLFLNSPTNNDNFRINSSIKELPTVSHVIEHLSSCEYFDDSLLVTINNPYGDILNNLLKETQIA